MVTSAATSRPASLGNAGSGTKGVAQGLIMCDILGHQQGTPEYDRYIIALALHDHAKLVIPRTFSREDLPEYLQSRVGEDSNSQYSKATHDIDMAKLIAHEAPRIIGVVAGNDEDLKESLTEDFRQVARAVAWHMGPWRSNMQLIKGGQPVKCFRCGAELSNRVIKLTITCPECEFINPSPMRATPEIIAERQSQIIRDAGELQGHVHMCDYIVSRSLTKGGKCTMSKDDWYIMNTVLPMLTKPEHFVRSFAPSGDNDANDAISVLKEHLIRKKGN